MASQRKKTAQNPLILQSNRLMEAFAKSNDERDYYLDKLEGFILYADLDKSQEVLDALENELLGHPDRYCLVPKLTFYETKKIMEGFVNEKVYDIDTKEKLNDIIQSKEARETFLEFIYDHHSELEKWHQYYQERSRIRIIEWLRKHSFRFVFEEDLDLTKNIVEKLKKNLFLAKAPKEVTAARKILEQKAKTYYSNEALNPRPKRGRPPKQIAKIEIEPQITCDIYLTVPKEVQTFLFTPAITNPSQITFSAKFETEEELLAHMRGGTHKAGEGQLDSLNKKLEELRRLSGEVFEPKEKKTPSDQIADELDMNDVELKLEEDLFKTTRAPAAKKKPAAAAKKPAAKKKPAPAAKKKPAPKKKPAAKKTPTKKPAAKKTPAKKPAPKKKPATKKKPAAKKKKKAK